MKKVNKFFSFIWTKFRHNLGLKILSVFFAILLWNYVVTATNPGVTRTYDNITVTVNGKEQLSERDLALMDSISSYIETAKVTIEINRNDLKDFEENDISVRVELAGITATGEHEVKLFADVNNGVVLKIVPESIIVQVDEKMSRIIPMVCETSGETSVDYNRGPLEITPNSIQVTGAKSVVLKIKNAYLSLNLSNVTESISSVEQYIFIDNDGNAVDVSALDISTDTVLLEMLVTPIKELAVIPGLLAEDLLAKGYEITKIQVEPETIRVTGLAELLEGLVTVNCESINLEGRSENVYLQGLKLLLPDNITVLGGINSVDVLIVIQEQMAEVDFEQLSIELRNIPEGFSVKDFNTLVDIRVRAPVNTIDNIAASHIMLYVDLTGAKEGETILPILYESPAEYRVESVTISLKTVPVVLE